MISKKTFPLKLPASKRIILNENSKTCVELYQKWKVTKLRYKTAPTNGIQVEVEYADTLDVINPDLESNFDQQNTFIKDYDFQNFKHLSQLSNTGKKQNYKPLTALCLHGAPGCHRDYQNLIKYLIKRNVRVIAPKFPDYSLTKKSPFCHSPAEKSEYIKDFLLAIEVDRIDLLICHSSSVFVAAKLIDDSIKLFDVNLDNSNSSDECIEKEKLNDCKDYNFNETQNKKLNDLDLIETDEEDKDYCDNHFEDDKINFEKNVKKDKNQNVLKIETENSFASNDEGYQELISENIKEKNVKKQAQKKYLESSNKKSKIYFGSLILINVCTLNKYKHLNPVLTNSLYEPAAFFYQLKISRSFFRFCGKIYLDIFGSPVDYNNFDNTILTLTTVLRSDIKKYKNQLERIIKSNLPILMFFSENDSLISKKYFYDLANFINVKCIKRDFSESSKHSSKQKVNIDSRENDLKKLNLNQDKNSVQIESQSTTSSDEFDSLRHNESELESDSSFSKNSCDVTLNKSLNDFKFKKNSSNDIKSLSNEYPYAVSIKKGRHYSHISHAHVFDEHIGYLIDVMNCSDNTKN